MEETLTIRVVFDYKGKGASPKETFEPNSIKSFKQEIKLALQEMEKYDHQSSKAKESADKLRVAQEKLAQAQQTLRKSVADSAKSMANGSFVLQSLNYTIRDSVYFAKDFQLGLLAIGNNLNPLIDGLLYLKVSAQQSGQTFKQAFLGLFTGVQGAVFGFTMLVSILQAVMFALDASESKAEKQVSIYDKLRQAIDELAESYRKAFYQKQKLDDIIYGTTPKSYDAMLKLQQRYEERVKYYQTPKTEIRVDWHTGASYEGLAKQLTEEEAKKEALKEFKEEERILLQQLPQRIELLSDILTTYMTKGTEKAKANYIQYLRKTGKWSDEERRLIADAFRTGAEQWSDTNKSFLGIEVSKVDLEALSGIAGNIKDRTSKSKIEDEYQGLRDLKGISFEYAKSIYDALKAKKELFNLPFTDKDTKNIRDQVKAMEELGAGYYAMGLAVEDVKQQIELARTANELDFNLKPKEINPDVTFVPMGNGMYLPIETSKIIEQNKQNDWIEEITNQSDEVLDNYVDIGNEMAWITELSNTMGNAIANAFMQGKFAVDKFLVSLVAVVAQMTLVAGIKSVLGGGNFFTGISNFFSGKASGGIVDGDSYWGDKVLTPINSGEMVLNKAQQQRLFGILAGKTPVNSGQPVIIMKNLLDGQKFLIETTKEIARSAR